MYNPITKLWEGYIYIIRNDISDCVYIGQTCVSLKSRWNDHLRNLKRGTNMYLYSCMKHNGVENYHPSVLETITCKTNKDLHKQLDKRERYYISVYHSVYPNGYNISLGRGCRSNKVYLFDFDKQLKNIYIDVRDASYWTGLSEPSIRDCCNGTTKTTRCGIFVYEKDVNRFNVQKNNYRNDVGIIKYNLDGLPIAKYKTISEAVKNEPYSYAIIWGNLTNHLCLDGKYTFLKEDEQFDFSIIKFRSVIDVYDCNDCFCGTFNSANDVCKHIDTGLSAYTINSQCNVIPKHKYNFRYKFIRRMENQPCMKKYNQIVIKSGGIN